MKRAFLLPLVLFISTILLTLATGMLQSQSRAGQRGLLNAVGAQSRACAVAGIEDARSKLDHDLLFPPPGDDEQYKFTYVENVTRVGSGSAVGKFTLTVDRSYSGAPYFLIVLISEGQAVGATHPYRVTAELDACPYNRTTGNVTSSNPSPLEMLSWSEEG